jgi:hypothetical protein
MLEPFRQVGQWASQKAQSLPIITMQPNSDAAQTSPFDPYASAYGPLQPPSQSPDTMFQETASTQTRLWKSPAKQLLQAEKDRVTALAQKILQAPWFQKLSTKLPWHQPKPSAPNPPLSHSSLQVAELPAQKTELPLGERVAQKLHLKKKPPPPTHTTASPYRLREEVLKDFPFRNLSDFPHFTLSPAEISVNVQAEKLNALTIELQTQPPKNQNMFMPFDDWTG